VYVRNSPRKYIILESRQIIEQEYRRIQVCKILSITSNRAKRTTKSIDKKKGGGGRIESFFEENITVYKR
jgi:hypothetical protein